MFERFKEKLVGKKVLVTGGAGFIGSNLCEVLLSLGAKVTCLDNLATGHKHNIEPFFENENFNLIEGDIRDLGTCHTACASQDFVLHQAALGSVPRSINDPITTSEVYVSGKTVAGEIIS
jgi:UDP-N-acetylglucosamine/UDP-N-acetylgalactosamine 4-epimerase